MKAPVIFREDDHTYWQGEKRLPSVTEILRPLMSDLRFVKADVLEWKSNLGRAVHQAIELHLADDLEYSSLDNDVAQYFDQFLAFQRDTGFKSLGTELLVSHAIGYAGRLDCVGKINGKDGVFDWKTTAQISPVVALQTAAYAFAFDLDPSHDFMMVNGRRYALRLDRSKYKLCPYPPHTYDHDLHAFRALLTMHKWCDNNGKILELAE